MNQIKTPSQRCMQMWPAGTEDRRWGDGRCGHWRGCCWSSSSAVIWFHVAHSALQCRGKVVMAAIRHPLSHHTCPPSSASSSAPPLLFITHRTRGEVRFRGSNCVYLPEKHTGWQLHVRWRCSAIKLHYTLDTLAIGMSFSLTTGHFG